MRRLSECGIKIAAGRLGIAVAEYRLHEDRDEHWCSRCRYWLPRRAFHVKRQAPRGCANLCKTHESLANRRPSSLRSRGITYAGPAYSTPAPAGVVILPDAAPAGAGHLYRSLCALNATQLRQAAATADLLGLPVGVVSRVRLEAVG